MHVKPLSIRLRMINSRFAGAEILGGVGCQIGIDVRVKAGSGSGEGWFG
jgi:hypothetical protein